MGTRTARCDEHQCQPCAEPLMNLDGSCSSWVAVKKPYATPTEQRRVVATGELMRKPRPNAYNPAQALFLISNDRSGSPLSCPSCSGIIERDPRQVPPPPYTHVTLRCKNCGRSAHYVAGAA